MNKGYSICLNIWALDKDIKNELGLLLIISSLCAEKGFCFASNKYLADLFDITDVSVSTKIKKLEQKNYISIEYEYRGCEVISRKIRLKNFLIDDLKKFNSTIKENFKDNNTNNKNININNIYEEYENKIGILNANHYKILDDYRNYLTDELIIEAINITYKNNIKNFNYLNTILQSFKVNKYKYIKDIKKPLKTYSKQVIDIPKWLNDKNINSEELDDNELQELEKEMSIFK